MNLSNSQLPNPISLVEAILAGLGVLAIGLSRLVVPDGLLIVLAAIVLGALKMARREPRPLRR
jgi:hypothetical protein